MKIAHSRTRTQEDPKVIRFGHHNTRRNLPEESSSKRGESNFLGKFERAYLTSGHTKEGAFARAREFSLNGYGRADIIWLAWSGSRGDFSALSLEKRIKLTAIEAKLKDWRKGLAQAARYRHFANRSILVLPPASAQTAVQFLDTFKQLGVGLWEFDPQQEKIKKHTTPRMGKPLNCQAHSNALQMISHRLDL